MVGPLLIVCKVSFQIIWEKEQFQYSKHNKELDKDDFPEGLPDRHSPKTVSIKAIYFIGIVKYHIHLVGETKIFQLYVSRQECTRLVPLAFQKGTKYPKPNNSVKNNYH
jgi:hypothetical protein